MLSPMRRSTFVVLSASALLFACGGATATDLFGDPAPADSTAPTATTPGTTPTSTSTTPPSPTLPPPEPTTPPTTPPKDAGGPPRDASVPDAAKPDASTTAGIACGTAGACALTDTCCALYQVASQTYRYECRAGKVTCPEPSTQIECDSAEDCPAGAKICCGDRVQVGGGGYYDKIECKSSCGGNDVTFCNPASPAASCGARACVASTLLPGYFACQQ